MTSHRGFLPVWSSDFWDPRLGQNPIIGLLLNLIEPTGGSAEVLGFDTRTMAKGNPLPVRRTA
jgi:hypothetical protein